MIFIVCVCVCVLTWTYAYPEGYIDAGEANEWSAAVTDAAALAILGLIWSTKEERNNKNPGLFGMNFLGDVFFPSLFLSKSAYCLV